METSKDKLNYSAKSKLKLEWKWLETIDNLDFKIIFQHQNIQLEKTLNRKQIIA